MNRETFSQNVKNLDVPEKILYFILIFLIWHLFKYMFLGLQLEEIQLTFKFDFLEKFLPQSGQLNISRVPLCFSFLCPNRDRFDVNSFPQSEQDSRSIFAWTSLILLLWRYSLFSIHNISIITCPFYNPLFLPAIFQTEILHFLRCCDY